jgi:L,D-peptidoglycan transpeptidase YkuD (ErfK/YbiS/YcfS/YnhG family)
MSVASLAAAVACFAGTHGSAQLLTVQAPPRSTVGTLSAWTRSGTCWRRVAGPWHAYLGRSGLSAHKREGDGTTPIGTFGIGGTVYGIAPDPGVRLRYHRLVCGDWWDEDPSSPGYNTFAHLPCGVAPPFGGDSEALWRISPQYRYFAVIDYNADPVVPGRGSAIFLHVSTGRPTAGCISLPERELVRTLRWLRPGAEVRIGIS